MSAKRSHAVAKRGLLHDVRGLIEQARSAVAVTVNAGLTMLYWKIGKRINAEVLKGARAEYGERIVATLSQELSWSHFNELPPGANSGAVRRNSSAAPEIRHAVGGEFVFPGGLNSDFSWTYCRKGR